MNVSKLATAFALVTSLAACPAIAQVVPSAGIQQPGAMTPVAAQQSAAVLGIQQPAPYSYVRPVATPVVAAPSIQQPAQYAAAAAQPVAVPAAPAVQQPMVFAPPAAPPTANALLQQPSAIGPPASAFANYYDDEEDDAEEEDDDTDDCGNDVGCGNAGCEPSNTCCGFEVGGWLQQGFTYNPYDPNDGNNGTVILNDLANQYMMNQFWLYANREVDNGGCGWDWGGRFDVLFGTDAQYFQMVDGLEESWGQNGHYQVAVLRFYYDIAYDDWTFRVGRWDTPVGYEPFDATESFFYSRSYNFYAQPGSLLGCFLTRHLTDQTSVSAGLHRGDMQFDDTDGNDSLGFIGGFSWESCDENTWFDAYLQTDEEGIGVDAVDYSLIGGTKLTENWDYVCEWYWGQNDQFNQQSEWYGLNQQLTREINDCWSHGFRFEWFRDDDGFIITDFLRGNSAQGPFDGNFFELTYAINYRPCENFVLRPEVRYDWYDASTAGPLPFDDGTKSDQFLLSLDAIWAF